jgi:hypothetical protein
LEGSVNQPTIIRKALDALAIYAGFVAGLKANGLPSRPLYYKTKSLIVHDRILTGRMEE